MVKQLRRMTAGLVAISGLLLAGHQRTAGCQTVTPVGTLELAKYVGTWYEVARFANKAEKHCASDAERLFALADKPGRFQMVTTCQTKEGFTDVRNADGRVADKNGDGKLKVATFWPFSRKEWVLALGPGYEWALVGSPNHKLLWVLSRTPTLKPEVLREIETKAAAEGFDTGKLLAVVQGKADAKETSLR